MPLSIRRVFPDFLEAHLLNLIRQFGVCALTSGLLQCKSNALLEIACWLMVFSGLSREMMMVH